MNKNFLEHYMKTKIQKLIFRECITAKTIQNIYNLLVSQPQVHKWFSDVNNHPSHWINFQNGFFDVMEWKMIEHSPKYLTINQIPFSFYPEQAETVLSGGENIRKYMEYSEIKLNKAIRNIWPLDLREVFLLPV